MFTDAVVGMKETFQWFQAQIAQTEAIKADKLTWSHVSDLQYWNNEVASLYMVKYIPQNIFVTSDGTIIKRQVKEDEIEALLDEYLK